MSPKSCPPKAPLIAVHAPNHALLWKNSSTELTSTLSVNFIVSWLRMIVKTEEKPLHVYMKFLMYHKIISSFSIQIIPPFIIIEEVLLLFESFKIQVP